MWGPARYSCLCLYPLFWPVESIRSRMDHPLPGWKVCPDARMDELLSLIFPSGQIGACGCICADGAVCPDGNSAAGLCVDLPLM